MKPSFSDEKGTAFVIAIMVIAFLTSFAITMLFKSTSESKAVGKSKSKNEVFYIGETGIQRTLRQIRDNVASNPLYYNDPSRFGTVFSNVASGSGYYTVTTTQGSADINGNNKVEATSVATIPFSGATKTIKVTFSPKYDSKKLKYAAFGLEQIKIAYSTQIIDSYNSALGPYGGSNVGSKGNLGSNATAYQKIDLLYAAVKGDVAVGTGADPNYVIKRGDNVIGNKYALSAPENVPIVTIPTGLGPGTDLIVPSGNVVNISEGTYYYKKITVSGSGVINTSGTVKIYCDDTVNISGGGINNTSLDPTKLQIMQKGNKGVSFSGSSNFFGVIYCPEANYTQNDSVTVFGSVISKIADLKGGPVHYDENVQIYAAGNTALTSFNISAWREAN